MTITVTGLKPRALVSIVINSCSATKPDCTPFQSSTWFRADARGAVDVARAGAVFGYYWGVWSMGPITTMGSASGDFYIWRDHGWSSFTLRVKENGRTLASTSFRRQLGPFQTVTRTYRDAARPPGFVGQYSAPQFRPGQPLRPGILVLGGCGGGGIDQPLLAAGLASRGYPSLNLAYYAAPHLPTDIFDIPLGYFQNALAWLGRQPGVDPGRLYVLGFSRGSEAALLLGVHYPNLVHGVIASMPSNVVYGEGCSAAASTAPAWTYRGRGIPYIGEPSTPDTAAEIPVEKIRGPIFLDCGGADLVWPSCAHVQMICSRLHDHPATYDYLHVRVEAPLAGHDAGSLFPFEPGWRDWPTFVPDERARERLWPALLGFLQGRGTGTNC